MEINAVGVGRGSSLALNVAVAALDVELAILKLQVALMRAGLHEPVREELDRSLRVAGCIKRVVCVGK